MATTTAPPLDVRLEHQELRRYLHALRVQLWWREALGVAAISTAVGALIGAASLILPIRPSWGGDASSIVAWLMAGALAISALVAALRRPSLIRAARVADRQLRTASRLATAAEVLEGRLGGSLAPAQLQDAWRTASGIRPWHAYPYGWRRVQVSAVSLAASLALLALSAVGALAPFVLPDATDQAASQASEAAVSQANDAAATAAAQALNAEQSANPAAPAQTLEDLQSQAAQSQAAETALKKLGDALRPTAAARDVGEALRAGNYDDAAARLSTLGQQSDQLSRVAKRELANAMQRAAFDSAKLDPPLAVAEDRVAKAMTRQVYSETRSSLENLAKAVGDAKQGIISQEALAQQLDQLQQQSAAPGGGGGDIGESDQGYVPDIPGQQPQQSGLAQGLASTIVIPGPEGDPSKATHSGVGQEAGGDPLGDLTSRLNVPPVDISVDAQLANDQGRNKPNPQAPTVKISDTNQNGVQPSDKVQPADPVQDVAEKVVEPTEQRDAVRAFFKSAGDNTTTTQAP